MSRAGGLDCLKGRKADHHQKTTILVEIKEEIHIVDSKEEVAEEGNRRRPTQAEGHPVDLVVYHLDHLLCLLQDPHLWVIEDLRGWIHPHLTEEAVPLVCHFFTHSTERIKHLFGFSSHKYCI
jgi:hypothetical protein